MAKSKTRRKIKIKWKNLLAGLLAFLAIAGSVVGIATLVGKKTKTISASAFSRGSFNAEGVFVKSNLSICTENMFECQGLTISPDTDTVGTFQVFYYDAEKLYIGSTEILNASSGIYTKGTSFTGAKYARVVLTPDAAHYGDADDDFKIRFYETWSYARDYVITVNKTQKYSPENLFEVKADGLDHCYKVSLGEQIDVVSLEGFGCSESVDVTGMEKIKLSVDNGDTVGVYNYAFLDESGTVLFGNNNEGKLQSFFLDVPDGAVSFVCSYVMGHNPIITQIV